MSNFTEAINPANGKVIGKFQVQKVDELKEIIERARVAQKEWENIPIPNRVKALKRMRDYVVDHADEIADAISKENGKTKVDALATEVLPVSMAISYYCKKAKSFLKPSKLSSGNIFLINKLSRIIRVPYGVVGIISPWNYPFTIPFSEVIMGLLAGNAVVLKVASQAQLVGSIISNAVAYSNLPFGVFNYINLPGKIAGDAFLDCGINKLFFTGSVEVGKYLMGHAAKTLTPVTLELGGNDPMIVCEDADLYRAVMGALWAGFQNAGQSCGGVERIYVHEKIYDEFMKLLKEKIDNLRVGNPEDSDTDMGCLTTIKQKETVQKHIKQAVEMGAEIYAESKVAIAEGNFLPAMVLINVNHDMMLMKDETFGPVVGVMKYSDYEEAIKLANDSYLGLTASVWTKNSKRGMNLASRLKAGAVTINDHLMSHGLAETPWGGFKESGIGRTHGKLGFDEMTQPVVIVNDILPFVKKNLWWHPYSKKVYDGIGGIMNLLYSHGLQRRFIGLIKLIKILPRMFTKK